MAKKATVKATTEVAENVEKVVEQNVVVEEATMETKSETIEEPEVVDITEDADAAPEITLNDEVVDFKKVKDAIDAVDTKIDVENDELEKIAEEAMKPLEEISDLSSKLVEEKKDMDEKLAANPEKAEEIIAEKKESAEKIVKDIEKIITTTKTGKPVKNFGGWWNGQGYGF